MTLIIDSLIDLHVSPRVDHRNHAPFPDIYGDLDQPLAHPHTGTTSARHLSINTTAAHHGHVSFP
jgi:hypothetical protein